MTKPCTTFSLTSALSSFKSSSKIGVTLDVVYSLPIIGAISLRLAATPALNCGVPSAYEFYKVGSIKLQIFSVLKFFKHLEILLIGIILTLVVAASIIIVKGNIDLKPKPKDYKIKVNAGKNELGASFLVTL